MTATTTQEIPAALPVSEAEDERARFAQPDRRVINLAFENVRRGVISILGINGFSRARFVALDEAHLRRTATGGKQTHSGENREQQKDKRGDVERGRRGERPDRASLLLYGLGFFVLFTRAVFCSFFCREFIFVFPVFRHKL